MGAGLDWGHWWLSKHAPVAAQSIGAPAKSEVWQKLRHHAATGRMTKSRACPKTGRWLRVSNAFTIGRESRECGSRRPALPMACGSFLEAGMAELQGGDRRSPDFRRSSLVMRNQRQSLTRSTTERVLAAIYTARFVSSEAPTIADVCRVSRCGGGHIVAVLARAPALAVRVGVDRIRLSGHGKAVILEVSGRSDSLYQNPNDSLTINADI